MISPEEQTCFQHRVRLREKPLSIRVKILFGILLSLPVLGGFTHAEVSKAIVQTRAMDAAFSRACDQKDGLVIQIDRGAPLCIDSEKTHLRVINLRK